jgi:hypothetical protein
VVRGTFRDEVPIIAPGKPTGTLVDVTFSLFLAGVLQPGAPGSRASYSLEGDLGGGFTDIGKSGHMDSGGAFVGDPFGLYTTTVQVQAGFNAPLQVTLTGSAQAGCVAVGSCGDAQFFLDHSLYWAGISSVTLPDGTPITDFTAIGASGVNWAESFVPAAAAVPAPPTLLLFVGGLAGFGLVRRRAH